MLYKIINSFGYNFTKTSVVTLNASTQLDSLLELFGNQTLNLNS
jgi:hypothetical protein